MASGTTDLIAQGALAYATGGASLAAPAAASAASSFGSAPATSSPIRQDMQADNGRNVFNIAPVGVNLGAILQPYQDSTYNGGYGVSTPSRWLANTLPSTPSGIFNDTVPTNPWLLGLAAVAALAALVLLRRKGG